MRSMLVVSLLLTACVDDALLDSSSQDLRPRCPVSNPDCELPDDPPPPPPDHPGHPVPDPGQVACNALVTGSVSTSTSGTVPQGLIQTVYWDVTLPTSCTPLGDITFAGTPVAPNGSLVVAPIATRVYALSFDGRLLASTTINVEIPKVVRITANTPDQIALFKQAAETPPAVNPLTGLIQAQTILLNPNVELDITSYSGVGIHVAEGVQILGQYPTPPYWSARNSNHLGPRIFSRARSAGLFWIRKNVTLRGFRLHGPDMGIAEGKSRGLMIESGANVELDNLEVAGFCEAGVYVSDSDGINNDFGDVRVHNSFLHHNQGPDGDGYGVVVLEGAKALIEHNVFDFNRHAIASTSGAPGTGYHANENLVLKGGGRHIAGPIEWATHMFDVHGSESSPAGDFDHGTGGELYLISKNTFQYDRGNDFKLRGLPSAGAHLTENIFPNSESSSVAISPALYASTWPPVHLDLSNNTGNKDTFGNYGVCDFDGDGIDDLFLATGRTWWFSSAGKYQWTFLGSQTDELRQIGLGDFNHDGRCDVLRERNNWWELSSGGKTPFVALPAGFGGAFNQLRFADFNGDGFTDVFRRLPSGQWLGYFDFTSPAPVALQSSSFPIEELRFGDFDGDHKTDVFAISNGVWSWSRSATEGWQPLNTSYHNLDGITMIADIDGLVGADVIRLKASWPTTTQAVLEVWLSSGGRGAWTKVGSLPLTMHTVNTATTAYDTYVPVGRFDAGPASLLKFDKADRVPMKFQPWQPLRPHGLYAL